MLFSTDDRTRALLQRYMRAWENADVSALVTVLREDAAFAMPPLPSWYRGRDDIRKFVERVLMAGDAHGRYRLRPTAANGMPAVAIYQKDPRTGVYGPLAIQLLQIEGDRIASVTSFVDPTLFARFALPANLDS